MSARSVPSVDDPQRTSRIARTQVIQDPRYPDTWPLTNVTEELAPEEDEEDRPSVEQEVGRNVFGCDRWSRRRWEPPYCQVPVIAERVKAPLSNIGAGQWPERRRVDAANVRRVRGAGTMA